MALKKHYYTIGQESPLIGKCSTEQIPVKPGDRVVIPRGTVVKHDKIGERVTETTMHVTVVRILNGQDGDPPANPRIYWKSSNIMISTDINSVALTGHFKEAREVSRATKIRRRAPKKEVGIAQPEHAPASESSTQGVMIIRSTEVITRDVFADLAIGDAFIVFPSSETNNFSQGKYHLLRKTDGPDGRSNAIQVADNIPIKLAEATPVIKIVVEIERAN